MEERNLKRALLYAAVAVMLGLTLVLIPLVTFSGSGYQSSNMAQSPLTGRFLEVEGKLSDTPKLSMADAEIISLSFIVAIIAYAFSRNSVYRREGRQIRWTPH